MVLAALLAGCSLPPLEGRHSSTAIPASQTRDTPLGNILAPQLSTHPGDTGIHLLFEPAETFAALTHLARAAQQSLDLQYYIWFSDHSGTLLLRELLHAADRGVRVRLLLDDLGTRQLDTQLAALHAHPNIEVRLFNPFTMRDVRWLSFLTDFNRANRRLHNKVFIADNQALISGGRNIGDSYFGATDGFVFSDLDILAVGPVVDDASQGFDAYWQSGSAYPADRILPPAGKDTLKHLGEKADALLSSQEARKLLAAVHDNHVVGGLLTGDLDLVWAPTTLVLDDPAKGLDPIAHEDLLTLALREEFAVPQESLDIISSFFVPGPTLTDALGILARRGVRVRVLTNSLDAIDMPPVHAGYARYRKPLLKSGVELYEMRRLVDKGLRPEGIGFFGSPATTLHAKAIVVDGKQLFIGSYNVDPRSILFNTEMGFVIDSPELAGKISHIFDLHAPQIAYRVELDGGQLRWMEQRDDEVILHEQEPGINVFKSIAAWLSSLLPIEWLL
ncbi:MAG: phospholipase D family protein [Halothiobacillaceae bacterium]